VGAAGSNDPVRTPYARLVRLVGDVRGLFLVAGVIAAAQSAVLAPLALIVKSVFDDAIPAKNTNAIVTSAILMLALFTTSALLGLLARRLAVKVVKTSVGRLRKELIAHMYELPRSWHDKQDARQLHATIVNDSERLDYLLTQLASSVVPAGLIVIALTVVGAVLNPLLFGVLAVVLPALALTARALGGRTRRLVRTWHDSLIGYSAETQTSLRALNLTTVGGAQAWELERRDRQIDEVTRRARALAESQAVYGTVQNVVIGVVGVVVLAIGGIAVTRDTLTLGELLSFYAIAALLLRYVAVVGPGISAAIVSLDALERLDELRLVAAPRPYSGSRQISFHGAVRFAKVSFSHGEERTLDGVDLTVAPGEHVALLGPNGSGKSTLVSLLLGLYRPATGAIHFDEVALDELDVPHLRRQIGVVLQDAVLLPGSIRDNIAYGRSDVTMTEIEAAARLATAAAFIADLPQGYDTEVGVEGELVSGGEAQRIAVARALLGSPALLVLDEPTTYLDDESVGSLLDAIAVLPSHPSVLTVTHDPHVSQRADRVVTLRDGRVIDSARSSASS